MPRENGVIRFASLGLGLLLLFLSYGCNKADIENESNPLLSEDLPRMIEILSAAEHRAAKETGLYYSGSIYRKCIKDPRNFAPFDPITVGQGKCTIFFEALLKYLRQNMGFENVTMEDLKDSKVFHRLEAAMMNRDGG